MTTPRLEQRNRTAGLGAGLAAAAFLGLCEPAAAAAPPGLDGTTLGLVWTLPFAGLLACIATGPLFFHHLWEHHYGKFAAAWAALTLLPLAVTQGLPPTLAALLGTLLLEYLPFIVVLFALFTISGGILVRGDLRGTPATNTAILAIGTVIASLVGTTGASMILIRPILRANGDRKYNVHVVVFFIFLVSNIGGGLTPLGDPPLFVGFLKGVGFFWTVENLLLQVCVAAGLLLLLFAVIDTLFYRRETQELRRRHDRGAAAVTVSGMVNVVLLLAVVVVILLSAKWNIGLSLAVFGVSLPLQNLLRDGLLIGIALLSLWLTPEEHRAANGFTFAPIKEVALLFAGIFVCIIPVLAILAAGRAGALSPLLEAVTALDGGPHERAYFWLTGLLSAVLDNAPTYLVFFELAGGDPVKLMGPLADALAAISLGAVMFGALTYIGNAPNFMVYAIARDAGIAMPTFFGYVVWSVTILIPLFVLVTLLFIPAS